ncbi:MAG: hypothetical protein ACK6D4_23715 [Planctomyces sp.]
MEFRQMMSVPHNRMSLIAPAGLVLLVWLCAGCSRGPESPSEATASSTATTSADGAEQVS